VDLVIDDPELPQTTQTALNGIREAEWGRRAAEHEAEAQRVRMVGEARAEAESTLLKAKALAGFRMEIAEGNAAAIAVMQGKIGLRWTERTIGEGESAQKVKTPVYVDRDGNPTPPPEIDMPPEVILDFFKVIDGNDAIRDAAAKPGTTILLPHDGMRRGGSDIGQWIAAQRAGDAAAWAARLNQSASFKRPFGQAPVEKPKHAPKSHYERAYAAGRRVRAVMRCLNPDKGMTLCRSKGEPALYSLYSTQTATPESDQTAHARRRMRWRNLTALPGSLPAQSDFMTNTVYI